MFRIDDRKVFNVHDDGSAHQLENVKLIRQTYFPEEDKTQTQIMIEEDNPSSVLDGIQSGEVKVTKFSYDAVDLYDNLHVLHKNLQDLVSNPKISEDDTYVAFSINKSNVYGLIEKLNTALDKFIEDKPKKESTITSDDDEEED